MGEIVDTSAETAPMKLAEETEGESPCVEAVPEATAGGKPQADVLAVLALKRKRGGAKAPPSLEVMASRIKRCHEEADQAEALLTRTEAELMELVKQKEAKVAALRSSVEDKRAEAQRASQEYVRKQCEAALAQLESCAPTRPPYPYVRFTQDVKHAKASQMWAQLSPEEKKKYYDRFEAETKKFKEWGSSEEGRKNLAERSEIFRRIKAEGKEELDKAVAAAEGGVTSPAKRASTEPTNVTPAKQRRAVPAGTPSAGGTEVQWDEEVLKEAGRADLLEQLRNLAARPDVRALGKTPQELWQVLKASSGMVNAAKRALLSA